MHLVSIPPVMTVLPHHIEASKLSLKLWGWFYLPQIQWPFQVSRRVISGSELINSPLRLSSLISLCGTFAHPAFQARWNDELPCVLCFYIQAFASTISSAWNVLCRLHLVSPYESLRFRWKNSGPSLPKQPVTQSSELPKHLAHAPVTAQSHCMTMAVSKIAF